MADAATTKIDIVIKTESKFRTGGVKEDALRWNYVHKIIEWWTGEEWKSVYVESQGQGVTGSITFKLADGKTYQFTGSEVIDLSNGVYYAANCKDAEHAAEADEAVHALDADNATFATNADKAKRDEQGAIIHETYATIAWVNEIVNGTTDQLPASGMSWEVDADYANGATVTLPSSLKYVFGTHSLRLALDGAVLSQGISYSEVDMGVATSSKINLMCALEKGMILDIWIIPVGINSGMMVLADAVQAKLNQYRDEAETVHIEVVESRSVIRNEVNSAKSTLQSYVDQASDLLSDADAITDECEAFRTEYLEYLKTCEVFMDSAEASAFAARAATDEAIDNVVTSRELLNLTTDQATLATNKANVATQQATIATNQANASGASASAAAISEANAKASENAAKESENAAKASQTASKTSETNAKASEDAAKTSETNAANSATEAANTLSEAVDTINTTKTAAVNAVKSQQTISVNAVKTQGDTEVARLEALADMLQLNAEAVNTMTVYTVTSAIASGATWTLPNSLQYLAGVGSLMLFYNGAYMARGSQYDELGSVGAASSSVTLLQDFAVGDEIGIVILAHSVYVNVDTSVGLTSGTDGTLSIDIAKLKTALGI